MKSLKIIAEGTRTDKDSAHNYLELYENVFSKFDNKKVENILEIGVETGDSLLMWAEYFPNATIWGFDIKEIDNNDVFNHPRIKTFIVDQRCEKSLSEIIKICPNFEVIIDDGGHTMEMHQKTLKHFFTKVKNDGVYVIEDLHTCSGKYKELYGNIVIQEGDTLTTVVLNALSEEKIDDKFSTNYLSTKDLFKIHDKIKKIQILKGRISEIAFILKK